MRDRDIVQYDDTEKDTDEIDLYEIFDILLKRKWTILVSTLIFSLLGLGAGLYYSRNITPEKYALDFTINYGILASEVIQNNTNIEVLPLSSLLNTDKHVERFFQLPKLQELYNKGKKAADPELENERKRAFLSKVFEVEYIAGGNEKDLSFNTKKYSISAALKKGNRELITELLETYLQILDEEVVRSTEIKLQKLRSLAENRERIYENRLSDQKYLTNELVKSENLVRENMQIDVVPLLRLLDPVNFSRNETDVARYRQWMGVEYAVSLILERIREGEFFRRNTSIYREEVSGKGKIILGVGVVFGVCLGLFLAFFMEFWGNYKKKKSTTALTTVD